ncbi:MULTISPECIES: glycoside hydrolase family 15 protein [unclassified Meiothermus]|uniref:glycoside hydrolase family 15 protein n=1 Tax=unclassified Meiothermus TaxID=370471 RepID=UPI000D7CF94C|nr:MULTISPECIES: glycoside hydrolase family 15 protein [unclassified Meiothermus]PZA06669.1 glucan 1,4-alpha-glucosidase [Meiothermus sp. Pnk-1]RYM29211.1 glucan 1,4-alpha-glucosidase [Meiothermus sp. PNK-Is4]
MEAFGAPGISPTWASSSKDLIGTALGPSRIWFTLGYGILNEVFWPSTGEPQIRDLGFIVAREGAWYEVKRVQRYTLSTPAPEVPLPRVVHRGEGYTLELEFLVDPNRDVVLVRYRLEGEGFRLYPLLAPHLGSSGHDNTAWVEGSVVYAQKGSVALALLSEPGFARASAGFVGFSDGWQDFHRNGAMTWSFSRAAEGNVALMSELLAPEGVLALGFAETPEGAQTLARSSLAEGYGAVRARYLEGWEAWARGLRIEGESPELTRMARTSAMVLRVHEDATYPGAVVASLSTPWGASHDDPGGYHLVWPRDAVEAGLALLAAGQVQDARRMLAYLMATQRPDGSWPQNFYPDGRPYWQGLQLDEVALPVLLAVRLAEAGGLSEGVPVRRMVQKALRFIARNGPYSPQDRWEENAGANPFTLGVQVAALAAGADFLPEPDRSYALSLADAWNARIEEWTYVEGTALDRRYGIRGHYVRLSPPGETALRGRIVLANRQGEALSARELLGLEFLYLVRLGLRSPEDPRIRETVRLVEALLRVELPTGIFYHRYNEDGYGEHADGSPFDGWGIGRAWPLLAGEWGHYALLAGEDPLPYLQAMVRSASPGGMIPEQVWDSPPIPERGLFPGRPSGSAMPLVWAHAEYLKLFLALQQGHPSEWLEGVAQRYQSPRPPQILHWRPDTPYRAILPGQTLWVEAAWPFTLHFGFDGWHGVQERQAAEVGLGCFGVQLEPALLRGHRSLEFTRRFEEGWEGQDYEVMLQEE